MREALIDGNGLPGLIKSNRLGQVQQTWRVNHVAPYGFVHVSRSQWDFYRRVGRACQYVQMELLMADVYWAIAD